VSIGVLLIVIFGFLVFLRRKNFKPWDGALLFCLGVLMSATLIGKIVQDMLGGIGQGITTLLGTMVGSG